MLLGPLETSGSFPSTRPLRATGFLRPWTNVRGSFSGFPFFLFLFWVVGCFCWVFFSGYVFWGSNFALEAMCVCPPLFLRENKTSRGQRDLSCGLCQRSSTLQIRKTYLLVDTTWMLRHSWCVSSCLLKAVSRSSGRVKPYCC